MEKTGGLTEELWKGVDILGNSLCNNSFILDIIQHLTMAGKTAIYVVNNAVWRQRNKEEDKKYTATMQA